MPEVLTETKSEISKVLSGFYEKMDGNPALEEYHARHDTQSAGILTIYDDERAALTADFLRERVADKIVVEIGAGIGLLACHVAMDARRVYAIEVEPAWASTFVSFLYRQKPANLSFIFGKAEEAPPIAADVAYFCTHSGRESMYRAATRFAPQVIDVYAELLRDNEDFKRLEPLTR